MTLEIITKTESTYFGNEKIEIPYGTLVIDGHSILDSIFYSDFNWLKSLESGIRKYFPQFCNLTASEVLVHPDLSVFKAYLQHQIKCKRRPFHSSSAFDENYNPEHYFNYSIPREAIAL